MEALTETGSEGFQKQFRRILSVAAVAITLTLLFKEYRFEEQCKAYEEEKIWTLARQKMTGDLEAALERCRAAAALAPADVYYVSALASSLEKKGLPLPLVAAFYERVIELDPDYIVSYGALASLWARMGRSETALELLQEAHERAPWDKNPLAALESLRKAIAQSEKVRDGASDILTRAKLAESFYNSGDYEESAAIYLELVQQQPNNPVFRVNLGSALFESGDLPQALDATKRAKDMLPNSPVPCYNLGLIRLCMGDESGSLEAYKEALDKDPEGTLIPSAISDLERCKERISDSSSFLAVSNLLRSPVSVSP